MNKYEIEVTGMSCGHCVSRVESALETISGKVSVDLGANLAVVESDRPLDELLTALDEAGYPGKLRA
jgi:copper chaperone